MDDFGFFFKGYKQFRDWQAFGPLNKVNLVIGKNNVGKTKLCEVALAFYQPDYSYNAGSDFPIIPCLGTGKGLLSTVLGRHFKPSSPSIKTFSDLLGDCVPVSLSYGLGDSAYMDLLRTRFGELYSSLVSFPPYRGAFTDFSGLLYDAFKEDRKKHPSIISYIHSDREVLSSPNSAMIFPDGGPVFKDDDATRLAYYFLNYAGGDETVILEKVREALNRVMGEEGQYSSISVKQVTNDKNDLRYETFVEDAKTKKRFALSECGNGLQTIFLVLLSLYANKPNDTMLSRLFIFEELENNLHPYAERRLYQLILEYSKEVPGRRFIITTHSNAAIDVFSGSHDCSLFSVEKDEKNPEFSTIRPLSTNDDVSEAITNLGVKASDLLQANGLLWVEGPSDRLYLNKWIHLLDPTLLENIHYQYSYYGGRLLAHYTADEENSLIRILSINRHSALFMDSDKSKDGDEINQTKKRILQEMGDGDHPAFVTAGREIENYIPLAVIRSLAQDEKLSFSSYDDIAPIAKKIMNDGSADSNHFDKIGFAKKACDKITAENLDVLHLKQTIERVVDTIRKWNGIP
jgi:putative ATP-dependent endonuclease of OLD family